MSVFIISIFLYLCFLGQNIYPGFFSSFIMSTITPITDFSRSICHSFLHANLKHLFENLIFFNIFGLIIAYNKEKWYHLFLLCFVCSFVAAFGFRYCSLSSILNRTTYCLGFSGVVFGVIVYALLSSKKHIFVQFLLLIFTTYMIILNLFMFWNGTIPIAYEAHIFGAIGGGLYRIVTLMFRDIFDRLNRIFYLY